MFVHNNTEVTNNPYFLSVFDSHCTLNVLKASIFSFSLSQLSSAIKPLCDTVTDWLEITHVKSWECEAFL